MLKIIDPLRRKLERTLADGKVHPLSRARQHFGTRGDMTSLLDEIKRSQDKRHRDERSYLLVDLTPFERIGDQVGELIEGTDRFSNPRPLFMTMSSEVCTELLNGRSSVRPSLVVYAPNGEFSELIAGSNELDKSVIPQLDKDLQLRNSAKNLTKLRKWFSDQMLTQLLLEPNCLEIPNEEDILKNKAVYKSGRYYLKMPNGMIVTCYINLKEIAKEHTALQRLGYEYMLHLVEFFRRDKSPLNDFQYLLAPNNTALFLASAVQAIIEKPLIAVDRLGPIPALQLRRKKLGEILAGKAVVVIEEVVGTGSEVDRTVIFLNDIGAEIKLILALYNLGVGKPFLPLPGQLVSLCRPREELKYVYRSQ